MRTLSYLSIGIFFGITLFKSEAASWFRIYEMFRFESFHMYGIIGTALCLGILTTQAIKRFEINSFYGEKIEFKPKDKKCQALPLWRHFIWIGMGFGRRMPRTDVCPFGRRILLHCHCDCSSPLRNLLVRGLEGKAASFLDIKIRFYL